MSAAIRITQPEFGGHDTWIGMTYAAFVREKDANIITPIYDFDVLQTPINHKLKYYQNNININYFTFCNNVLLFVPF